MSTLVINGSSTVTQTIPAAQDSFFPFTHAKIQKVAFAVLAALAIAVGAAVITGGVFLTMGAVVSLGAGVGIACIAVPCFIGAGCAIWKITRIKDYENSSELATYRAEACIKSLKVVAEEHGWNNMFLHGIPTPDLFPARYNELVQSQCLNSALGTYDEVQSQYNAYLQGGGSLRYTIPQPLELRGKWTQEIAGKTASEILGTFNIESLVRYGILDAASRQVVALRVAKGALTAAQTASSARERVIEEEYQQLVAPHKASLEQVKRAANAARSAQQQLNWEIFRREGEHWSDLNRNPHDRVAQARIHADYYNRLYRHQSVNADGMIREAEALFNLNTAAFKQAADRKKEESKAQFNQACNQVNETYRRNA